MEYNKHIKHINTQDLTLHVLTADITKIQKDVKLVINPDLLKRVYGDDKFSIYE